LTASRYGAIGSNACVLPAARAQADAMGTPVTKTMGTPVTKNWAAHYQWAANQRE
jgi:hypothetical protein